MSTCIARQPIFNKDMEIFGYELLYRNSENSMVYDGADGDASSSRTIINSFHHIGINRVTGGKRAFINFTERLILEMVPTLLPNRVLVVEVLETIRPTEKILESCRSLRRQGYTLALDDFILTPEYMPLLEIADIIKIDFLATPVADIQAFVHSLRHKKVTLLAEKLETREAFEHAKEMGFSLFQGYFFSQPSIIKMGEATLTPLRVNCVQLLRSAFMPNVDFSGIADVIKQDVALSYRLLRVVNSAFFGLRYSVKNIRQAISILGIEEIRKWVALISLAEMREDKPDELIQMSLLRARMLELLAPMANMGREREILFLIGMMSLMDVIMDMDFEEIARHTNLADNIYRPIQNLEGIYGDLLKMILHYERSEFEAAIAIGRQYGITADHLAKGYVAAAEWAGILGH